MEFNNLKIQQKAFSLLMAILILSIMLTAVLIVSDMMLRQGKIMKNITTSERAYLAAEAGAERTLYEINKARQKNINTELSGCWCGVDCNNCQINYSDSNALWQVISIVEDKKTVSDPLEVSLAEGESFQLNLDMAGATYPDKSGDDLVFERISGSAGGLIVFKENKSTGEVIQYGPDNSTPTSTDLDIANYYYIFKIRNPLGSGELINYQVKPLGTENLAVGVTAIISSVYKGVERRIETNNSKWQIYGQ
ncbi:MAG: hypothetical protein Athens101410_455 [Parcubacteria group bacterium Athens1014_10]|nr:MAG: hypothetical protein Athens101410_455 [Parcubacteria group bacterium Athens1014_10]TSD05237.1 MAG: hypothetical protein Athens071412_435 [Parcubacteria group bacterium Athens0714_12]